MKIQCSCGTKYAFDITPDMVANPVRLVCQNCGADNSAAVNQIIQQQFGTAATETTTAPAAPAVPASAAPRLRVNVHTAPAAAAPEVAAAAAPQLCRKHPGQFTTEHCLVCQKPICPQCMAIFGYVCSAFCKNEAEQRGMEIPVYENHFGAVAARSTRKLGHIILGISAALVLLLGGYGWFLFVGSKPRVVFSAKFSTPAYNGGGKLLGTEAVLLHGGHLARFDLKSKKEIWGVDLIDAKEIMVQAEAALVKENEEIEYWKKNFRGDGSTAPSRHSKEEFFQMGLASAQSEYTLHVHEQNIWLRTRRKLVQYDWATGKPGREVALSGSIERAVAAQDSLLIFLRTKTGEEMTKLDLKSGETQTQQISERPRLAGMGRSNRVAVAANAAGKTNATLLAQRGSGANPALKGYKVAQPDPLAQRLAAPAIAANTVQNKRIERELKEDDERMPAYEFDSSQRQFINDRGSLVEFSAKLLEAKTLDRQAMKAPPKKSAL
ncbi:MAG TPA: B-box zinc finger protein, partial [Verrucomicrobiae bacterium]